MRILGWSDGGVIGLLLSLKHSDKVNKLAIMGANIRSDAAYDWSIVLAKKELSRINSKIAEDDQSEPWENMRQHILLLFEDPNIPTENLKKIKTPTLVMAGDEDVIRHEHTLEIYHALPNAHLCIFPGSTHGAPITDSQLFNQITDHFFREPFKRPTTRAFYEKHF